jgi:DNA-binding transcriptional ArsR family regulator
MTKAQKFAIIADLPQVKADPMLAEFIAHEIELLAKKNTTEKKPTAKQAANASVKDNIVALMESDADRLFTITELCKEVADLPEDMTPQRMSAIVRQLKEDGIVERIEEKRKAYFRLAR